VSSEVVISHRQVEAMLQGQRETRASVRTSIDLGLTTAEVHLNPEGVSFPGGERLDWNSLEEVHRSENACFRVVSGSAIKIRTFSEWTNRFYGLMPTSAAPTLLISGIPMHRIKDTDPYRDTLSKIRAIAPITGRVLDSATGLGYTAIEAAKTASLVITIELDPAVLEIARLNPWSQGLFHNRTIQQLVGDSTEEVMEFGTESFSRIIHDPPMLSLAGQMYSLAFYRQAFRILKPGGRLFHYIGNPQSKSGAITTKGVVRRLKEAGFRRIRSRPRAFGVVACK